MTNNTSLLSHFFLFVFVFFSLLFSVFTMEYYLLEDGLLMPDSFFDAKVIEESRAEVHAMIKSTKSVLPRSISILSNRVCFPPFHNAVMFNTFGFLSNGHHYRSFFSVSGYSSIIENVILYRELYQSLLEMNRTVHQIIKSGIFDVNNVKIISMFYDSNILLKSINSFFYYPENKHRFFIGLYNAMQNNKALLDLKNSPFGTDMILELSKMDNQFMSSFSDYRLYYLDSINASSKMYNLFNPGIFVNLKGSRSISNSVIQDHICYCIINDDKYYFFTITTKPIGKIYDSVRDVEDIYPHLTYISDIPTNICFRLVQDEKFTIYVRPTGQCFNKDTVLNAIKEAMDVSPSNFITTMSAYKLDYYISIGKANLVICNDLSSLFSKLK